VAGDKVTSRGPRPQHVAAALKLVALSVTFGLLSGAVSITTGLQDHSLGVLAVGLDVLADVTGSAILIWRFRAESSNAVQSDTAEVRAAAVVAIALAIVSIALVIEAATALASRSRPGSSGITLTVAAVSLVILTPLAIAKRRLGRRMNSAALQGDGALSGIGAATSLMALIALGLYHALGWWWADRAAAIVVALIAAAEAWHTWPAHTQLTRDRFPVSESD
jgi:divalent metal cation (Fe/Co/Zn/Cd) transporter